MVNHTVERGMKSRGVLAVLVLGNIECRERTSYFYQWPRPGLNSKLNKLHTIAGDFNWITVLSFRPVHADVRRQREVFFLPLDRVLNDAKLFRNLPKNVVLDSPGLVLW